MRWSATRFSCCSASSTFAAHSRWISTPREKEMYSMGMSVGDRRSALEAFYTRFGEFLECRDVCRTTDADVFGR